MTSATTVLSSWYRTIPSSDRILRGRSIAHLASGQSTGTHRAPAYGLGIPYRTPCRRQRLRDLKAPSLPPSLSAPCHLQFHNPNPSTASYASNSASAHACLSTPTTRQRHTTAIVFVSPILGCRRSSFGPSHCVQGYFYCADIFPLNIRLHISRAQDVSAESEAHLGRMSPSTFASFPLLLLPSSIRQRFGRRVLLYVCVLNPYRDVQCIYHFRYHTVLRIVRTAKL
jgi:hypothetical protein